jgi:CheY-like chemotaxis protein/HPt (histidine-containing phosphotransfer) domain-containing protein
MLPMALDSQPAPTPLPTADLNGLRVFIVDDNEVNRSVVREEIASFKMRSDSDASGEQALEALLVAQASGDPFDFLIADFQMPIMDGATLAAKIKADPAIKNTVVVMLTSVGDWREVRAMKGAGIDECVVKPVRQAQLHKALANAWSSRGLTLPAKAQLAAAATAPAPKPSVKREFESSIRVLVAEDNVVNQKVAVGMLEKLGVRADVAANGREAVEMLRNLPYDIVFMDCQMPEMNGYEAVGEIRRQEQPDRHVPVIAMTADAIAGSRERCIEAGMDDYIAKPVKMEALLNALTRWAAPKEIERISQHHAGWTLPEALRELADDGDPGLILELIEAFRADTAPRLGRMGEAIANADTKGLSSAAHTIKGCARQMGADAMASICQELELAAMDTPTPELVRRLTALEAEFAEVSRAMSLWT